MRKPATDSLLNRIKREAKQAVSPTTTYMQALDALAVQEGYQDWRAIALANGERNAAEGDEIPLDPVLPPNFDNRPNEERSKAELDRFWRRPFILSRDDGKYDVRCLDGGAWDRSTGYGVADTLDDARALARRKLSAWIAIMARPVPRMRRDGLFDLIQLSNRPDEEPVVYASGITQAEAVRQIALYEAQNPEPQ
ncbi:hypothetical protein RQP54_17950 [Curvibacter sp. APW13]|uniref:hypothetical protein n=1 Tax=Curvibacter sp. APW13 TaxID=3077236 RepID=UPI0028DFA9FE|nr:hypothetical protein [Curvibacter sp. APW13]MDT8992761.1 hypothetical protein [Curvibacter sp. APW13]